jgi:hypothetical protein
MVGSFVLGFVLGAIVTFAWITWKCFGVMKNDV